jgi:hypothetical protein
MKKTPIDVAVSELIDEPRRNVRRDAIRRDAIRRDAIRRRKDSAASAFASLYTMP